MDAPTTAARRVLPWASLCTGLGVLALVIAVARYDALPDPYPTHFGFSGDADSFSDKSWGDVLFPVVMGQLSALVMIVIALAVTGRGARLRTPLAALGCAIGGGTSAMSTLQYLADDAQPPPWAFWAFLVVVLT